MILSGLWKDRQRNRGVVKASKASNDGFSLVELLIAVIILAIIAIPLLHMFITSGKINVKSRQMLRATTVAQDIMEGLKAYTLEEVRAQFTPPEGVSESTYFYPSEGFYIMDSSLIQGGVREITELEVTDPYDPDKEIYYFGIENIKIQGGEYDALIKLDASTYTEDKAGDADAHDNAFNGAFYGKIGSVSEVNGGGDESVKETDSSYHEHKELNSGVLEDIKQQIEYDVAASGQTLPDNWDDMKLEDFLNKRTIHVTIEDAGSEDAMGNPQCLATITFTYDCSYPKGSTDPSNQYTSYGAAGSAAGEVNGIRRTFSSGNFYLFFYPFYQVGAEIDNIEFEIKDAAKLFNEKQPLLKSITLAKQIRSNVDTTNNVIEPEMSDTDLYEAEKSYSILVDISVDGSMESNLLFKSNLETNLGVDPADGERGKELFASGIRFGGGFLNYNIYQDNLVGEYTNEMVTDAIYDIEITIYEAGAAKHFADADFENNDEVHKLATITNLD